MCKLRLSWLIGSVLAMSSVVVNVAWGRLIGAGDSPDQLLQKSDAIFAGRAHDIVEGEKEVLAVHGVRVDGRWRIAAFQIDDAIKGDVGHDARVSFFETKGMDGPFSSIDRDVRCVVFVRKADGGYRLIDPDAPVIRLNPKAPPPLPANASTRDRLRAELEAAASADAEIAIPAIDWLVQFGKEALPTFLAVSKSADPNVKATAVAASLRVGDASLLPSVSQLVRVPGLTDAKEGLYEAVSSIKNPEYAPAVADLLDADDVGLRRAASYAIRSIGDKTLLPKLAKCLDDPDREVQYNATMGLARLLNRNEWAASKAVFMKDPEPYLAKWRAWWQGVGNKGQGQPKP